MKLKGQSPCFSGFLYIFAGAVLDVAVVGTQAKMKMMSVGLGCRLVL